MDPPPYDDVVQPRPPTPPPTYSVAVLPSDPPPTYGEADAFPVLAPPVILPLAPSPVPDPATQAWVNGTPESGPHAPVVTDQPQAQLTQLAGAPGVVRCPYCQELGTTEVEHKPGQAAWSLCVVLTLLGCVCGCCLIPFMVNGIQDVHHSCSHCHRHLHIHTR